MYLVATKVFPKIILDVNRLSYISHRKKEFVSPLVEVMVLTTKQKLSILNKIIFRELIRGSYYGACLPSVLMFYDEAKDLGLNPDLVLGHFTHKLLNLPVMHFVVKIDGEVYDPTRKVLEHYTGTNTDDFVFEEVDVLPTGDEELSMKSFYLQFKKTQDSKMYFHQAPETLRAIRKRVQQKAKKLLRNR